MTTQAKAPPAKPPETDGPVVANQQAVPAEDDKEAKRRQKETDELILGALHLLEVGQGDLSRKRFEEASRNDPEDIRGLSGGTFLALQPLIGSRRRSIFRGAAIDPAHAGATTSPWRGSPQIRYCAEQLGAAAKAGPAREIVQNSGDSRPGGQADDSLAPCAGRIRRRTLRQSGARIDGPAFDSRVGWLYMRYYPASGAAKLPAETAPQPKEATPGKDGLVTIGSGSGFSSTRTISSPTATWPRTATHFAWPWDRT